MNKPESVARDSCASHCSCGAALADEVWADQGMCQMCWESHCSDEFWRRLDESDAAVASLVFFGLALGIGVGSVATALFLWFA